MTNQRQGGPRRQEATDNEHVVEIMIYSHMTEATGFNFHDESTASCRTKKHGHVHFIYEIAGISPFIRFNGACRKYELTDNQYRWNIL